MFVARCTRPRRFLESSLAYGMSFSGIPSVAWLGRPHALVIEALRLRGISVQMQRKRGVAMKSRIHTAIFHYEGDQPSLSKFLSAAKTHLDRGIHVSIVASRADFANASLAVSSFAKSYIVSQNFASYETNPISADIGTQIRVYNLDKPASASELGLDVPTEVANTCALYAIERPINPKLRIRANTSIDATFEALLKRAFNDFQVIELDDLPGGRSRIGGVWKIVGINSKGIRCEPFVVKFGSKTQLSAEIESNRAYVEDLIPFQNHPAIAYDRCADGMGERLLVSHFVDGATRLDDFLVRVSPTLGITALFDRALRTWRSPVNQKTERVRIAERFRDFWAIPALADHVDLQPAYQLTRKQRLTALKPETLLQKLYKARKVECRLAHAHGDLHARNIFVRDNSAEVVLIDFATWQQLSPLSRDPATLDVALAFDVWDEGKDQKDVAPLSVSKIEQMYSPPLLCPPRRPYEGHRDQAITRLRIEATSDCSEEEYRHSIICCLLRFARFKPKGSVVHMERVNKLRAVAYHHASRLAGGK